MGAPQLLTGGLSDGVLPEEPLLFLSTSKSAVDAMNDTCSTCLVSGGRKACGQSLQGGSQYKEDKIPSVVGF